MALQRIPLLPLLSRCPLLARKHLASGTLCTFWHHTTATHPYTRTVLMDERHKGSDHKFLQSRNFYSFFKKSKSPEKIREGDNIESHYELVYVANSSTYVYFALGGVQTVAGIACLTLGAIACGLPIENAAVITEQPIHVTIFIAINSMICMGILRICTWYPLRIYYSEVEDTFVVVFVGVHPFAIRRVKIKSGEVKPDPPGFITSIVLPWSHHLYSAPTQIIHLNVELFKYPFYYNKLLGYVPESSK